MYPLSSLHIFVSVVFSTFVFIVYHAFDVIFYLHNNNNNNNNIFSLQFLIHSTIVHVFNEKCTMSYTFLQ